MTKTTFETHNTTYVLADVGDGAFLLSGHARYCPAPTLVRLISGPVEVGRRVVFATLDGPRKGKVTMTTPVVRIES